MGAIDPNQPDDSNADNDEQSLQAQLQAYYRSIEQEFDIEAKPELIDADIMADTIKKRMIEKLPVAFRSLAYLAEHADSESIRFQSSKYIIEAAIGKQAIAPPGDPWKDLFGSMRPDPPANMTGPTFKPIDPQDLPPSE